MPTQALGLRKNWGLSLRFFAYPYGEYGSEIKKVIQEAGFLKRLLGSSLVSLMPGFDQYAYPRFAMNENYGGIGRLRLAANAFAIARKRYHANR